ncbi:MAG: triose-phosphate isomerase [Thermoplasmata archaeon]
MDSKVIIVNMKNYSESTGKKFDLMMLNMKASSNDYRKIVSPSYLDLHKGELYPDFEFFAQHVDEYDPGPFTGKIIMENLLYNGIHGSLLNHSENRIPPERIKKILEKARKLDFEIVLCVEALEEARDYIRYEPDYIAYEPRELIGGNISVSSSKPEIISDIVKIAEGFSSKILVGAGIKNGDDVKKAIGLGASGILVSSGIVKAKDPSVALNSLMK